MLSGREPQVAVGREPGSAPEGECLVHRRGRGGAELRDTESPDRAAGDAGGHVEDGGRADRQITGGGECYVVLHVHERAHRGGRLRLELRDRDAAAPPRAHAVGDPDVARRQDRDAAGGARLPDRRPVADHDLRIRRNGVDTARGAIASFRDDPAAGHAGGEVAAGAANDVVASQQHRTAGVDVGRRGNPRLGRGGCGEGGRGQADAGDEAPVIGVGLRGEGLLPFGRDHKRADGQRFPRRCRADCRQRRGRIRERGRCQRAANDAARTGQCVNTRRVAVAGRHPEQAHPLPNGCGIARAETRLDHHRRGDLCAIVPAAHKAAGAAPLVGCERRDRVGRDPHGGR